jgi:hypothetical protein
MRKLFFVFAFMAMMVSVSSVKADNYFVNDNAIEDLFATSEDQTAEMLDLSNPLLTSSVMGTKAAANQTVVGFLLRSYFCGFIALHRSYMGTGGKTLWYYYFCIPVVGGVVNFVDFCWVLFKGSDAMNKYKDNPKFIVWKS